ncbi:hypothetical protein [Pelagibius sp.]|uniref:hypothetical protein n=1 Tax=Pelagibius sp. TaxID=1931238 RepID=UPI0026337855|nr:hypothetical protein [Pelagibius sp.]
MAEKSTDKMLAVWPDDEVLGRLGRPVEKRDLTTQDVKDLLRLGRLRFVVLSLGEPVFEVSLADCYDFWKRDVKHHICDQEHCYLEDFEGDYFYFATEWDDRSGIPLVLLFKSH